MSRALRVACIVSFGAIVLSGCAARKPSPAGLYAGLKERPETVEAHALAGKVIVIDPGHGGSLNGALGADSLREADANLGVALYLWGLCKNAGADAYMTRTTDRDLLPAGSKDASDDLRSRAAMANALTPDVFLSIHHNSNLPRSRDVNNTEVYYRASDPGASLELAQAIQVHLARNLGIETSDVKPGSYMVLRLSTAQAAVLGEASYLSSPAVEERLKLSEKQKLEAEAYFLGLLEYFSRGVPGLARLSPPRDTLASPAEISFSVRTDAGIPIDPASARIAVGAQETPALFDPVTSTMRLAADPWLQNGTHTVQGTVRSIRGATVRSAPFTFLLARPPRFILPLPPREKPGSIATLSATVLDALGMRVADGTPAMARSIKDQTTLSGVCRNGVFSVDVPIEHARETFVLTVSGATDTVRFAALDGSPRIVVVARDARTGAAVAKAVISRGRESFAGDGEGFVIVPSTAPRETLVVSADGYRPLAIDTAGVRGEAAVVHAALEPLFAGVFHGKRIALDPGGGGTEAGGRGSAGLRGASVNLAVARITRELLERAGSAVTLTHEGDESISGQERVYVVNRSEADLAIGIRHGAPPESAGGPRVVLRYAGSERGRLLAEKLAAALGALPPADAFSTGEWAGVFLQQTASTACEIYAGPVEDAAHEALMRDDSWLRLEAERMLAGLAAYFGCDSIVPGGCSVRVVSRGMPAAGATVNLDALFARTTGADGSASFGLAEPGMHLVAVHTIDGRSGLFMKELAPNGGEMLIDLP